MGFHRPTDSEVRKQIDLSLYEFGLRPGQDYSVAYTPAERSFVVTGTDPRSGLSFTVTISAQDGLAAAHHALREALYDG